jgi:hypothetical protein
VIRQLGFGANVMKGGGSSRTGPGQPLACFDAAADLEELASVAAVVAVAAVAVVAVAATARTSPRRPFVVQLHGQAGGICKASNRVVAWKIVPEEISFGL